MATERPRKERPTAHRQYSTPMTLPGRRISRSITLLLLALVGLTGHGCGAAPVVTPLEARPVVATGPQGAPIAAGFQVDLKVHNPSSDDIPLERFDYVFLVEEVGRFEGRWAALRTLPPGDTVTMTIPASMTVPEDLADEVDLQGVFRWRIDGGVRYQAPGLLGQILFDAGIRRPSESFSGSGTFRLRSPDQPPRGTQNPSSKTENGPAASEGPLQEAPTSLPPAG